MNIIYTTSGSFLTLESQQNIQWWQGLSHIIEPMAIESVANYLRFAPSSRLAFIDAIVCAADTDLIAFDWAGYPYLTFPLYRALALAEDVASLPESCAMRDGRKWKSIPFIILCHRTDIGAAEAAKTHAHIFPSLDPIHSIGRIQKIVDDYHDRILDDYRNVGILVRFQEGRAQIGPALKRRHPSAETEYYYPPADRRNNKGWMTVKRDREGLQNDVEMFRMLLDRNAKETEMHQFFEQHPAILMQAMLGIPVSHAPSLSHPEKCTPDFVFSPILGPLIGGNGLDVLELKGPAEKILTRGLHRGFTARVHHAVDQVRDYERYLQDPANIEAILRALGYIPTSSRLAVLIGRAPKSSPEQTAFSQRQGELNVAIVTYDDVFARQADQLDQGHHPYRLQGSYE